MFVLRLISFTCAVMLIAACTASKQVGGGRQSSTGWSTDASIPPQRKLEQLAARETVTGGKDNQFPRADVPVPPGVEADVLAPRSSSQANAFMSLQEALLTLSPPTRPGDEPPPPDVDDESKTKALKLYAKGRSEALDGRHLQAITDLQKARELDPTSAEILRELAHSYISMGNSAQAADLYEKLVRLEPENSEALFSLGLAAASRRDFARAAAVLGRLRVAGRKFDHDPAADVLADFTLGVALRELGYDRASIQAAEAVLNSSGQLSGPTDHAARLGSVYRQRGETWRSIGDAHCRLGEFIEALQAYAASASSKLADPSVLHPRVIYANLRLGRVFNAQREMLAALTEQPDPAGAGGGASNGGVSDRDIRLCAYLRERAEPIDLLAQSVRSLYLAHPDESSYARAAASLLSTPEASDLLKEFVSRRPRDLDGVAQMLAWLAQGNVNAAVDLTIALSAEHPDLSDAYTDRLLLAVPQTSRLLTVVRAAARSAASVRVEARVLSKLGGLGEAWSLCDAARQKWPDDRGLALQQLQIASALHEPALFEKTLATVQGGQDAAWLLGLSQARRAMSQTAAAVELAEQAMKNDPRNVDAVIEVARAHGAHAVILAADADQRGAAALEAQRTEDATERAIQMAPQRDEGYEVLVLAYGPGGVLSDVNRLNDLKERLARANPHSALLARLMAQSDIGRKRYDQALERMLAQYESDASDSDSLKLAITAWQEWGRLETGEKWLNEHLAQRPGDLALLEQWVRVQIVRNRTDAAAARLQSQIEADAGDIYARRLLESIYRATGQIDSALELGEQRLLSRPQAAHREVELAALYAGAELGDKAFARLEWIQEHAADADLNDLSSAIAIAGRMRVDPDRRDHLTLALVTTTIERFPQAPLEVYGSGMRTLARLNRLDESFDALADQAVARARGARESTLQGAGPWRDLAQGLVDDEQPAAAARALRARLRAAVKSKPSSAGSNESPGKGSAVQASLEDKAFAFVGQLILVADAAADAAATRRASGDAPSEDIDSPFADQTLQLLKTLEERRVLGAALLVAEGIDMADACYQASIYYSMIGADSGAQRLLEETINLNPRNEMAMNNLGYMRLDSGLKDAHTISLIERAYELLPKESNIIDSMGWVRYKQGRFADELPAQPGDKPVLGAVSLIQAAVADDPQPTPDVYDHLGDAQWRNGDTQSALEAWRHAVKLLDEPEFQQRAIQNLQLVQTRYWQLVVVDPRMLYHREYDAKLEKIRQKLAAVEQGAQPQTAPTFAESQGH